MSDPRDDPLYAKTIHELRSLKDDDLIRQHDEIATRMGNPRPVVSLDYYLAELDRRRTRRIAWASLIVALVAAAAAIAAVVVAA